MTRLQAVSTSDRLHARALIESDRTYFELAARVERLAMGELAYMPGLGRLAASCVIQRLDLDRVCEVDPRWLQEIHAKLQSMDVGCARIYLDRCPEKFEEFLSENGYVSRAEIGYLTPATSPRPPQHVRLCPVLTNEDWDEKRRIHEQAMDGPDGYTNQADLWIDMERRKCQTGKMQTFLVRRNQEVVATVGAILGRNLLRLKNIVVAPQHRRRGIGVATVHLLWQLAERDHGCRLGVFGVDRGPGSRLYRRAGLYDVTIQYEWSRTIS